MMSIERKKEEGHPQKEHTGEYDVPSGRYINQAEEERRRDNERTALHPALESAFNALNATGVSWCLVRRPSNPAAPSGDVDLLVDQADVRRTRQTLRRLGFGRLPVWECRNTEAFYLLYHLPTRHNICLHVVTELSFGSGHAAQTGSAVGCLRRRRRRGVVFEPAPNDAFWILLLHCLVDKGTVSYRYRASLQELATSARADGELAGAADAICPYGWDAVKILERVRSEDWASLERLAQNLQESGKGYQLFNLGLWLAAALLGVLSSRSVRRYAWRKARSLISTFAEEPRLELAAGAPGVEEGHWVGNWVSETRQIFRFVRRGFRKIGSGLALAGHGYDGRTDRRRGLTVALLGPDGVGKSTLVAGIKDPLGLPVRKLYMGLGYAGLPRLARLPIPGSLAGVGLLTLWWRCLVAHHHRKRGRLVLFDRYTYDALLPGGRGLTKPQRFARWVWAHACPAPDLVVLLDAPGEVVHERRGESEPALLEIARLDFLSLRGRVTQLQVVDAARPEEAVRADVVERIQRRHAVLEGAARQNGDSA
jgi:thymidylate kinase